MTTDSITVQGWVRSDGTLELSERISLPPCEVQVTIRPAPQPKQDLWTVMERIWAEQRARGYVPRSREEIDADLNAMRDEAEEEMREIEAIHEECQRLRRAKDSPEERGP